MDRVSDSGWPVRRRRDPDGLAIHLAVRERWGCGTEERLREHRHEGDPELGESVTPRARGAKEAGQHREELEILRERGPLPRGFKSWP